VRPQINLYSNDDEYDRHDQQRMPKPMFSMSSPFALHEQYARWNADGDGRYQNPNRYDSNAHFLLIPCCW
jgi:hypothetical protein